MEPKTFSYPAGTRTATIVVRMQPPREVNPNAHVHWAKRAKAAVSFRAQAGWATRAELNTPGTALTAFCGYDVGGVVLDAEIAWCCRRQRLDDDNAKASLKALVDGIADVLWFGGDRHVTLGTVRQTRGTGIVTVTLIEAALRGGEG